MNFRIHSKNRELNLNTEAINTYVSRWKDCWFDVDITRKQAKKSDPLRNYYFVAVAKPYGEFLGYDADEVELLHRQLKIVFYQVQPDSKGVYRNRDVPSVFGNDSEIPVRGKAKFVEWVTRVAAKDGCYIEPREGI